MTVTLRGMDPIYTIRELCDLTGEAPRTIHYYVRNGLLPPAGSAGRGPRYHEGHVSRLQLIRRLQKEHLPLSEIRGQLEALTDEGAIRLAAESTDPAQQVPEDDSSALGYVRSVLSGDRRSPLPSTAAERDEHWLTTSRSRSRRGSPERTVAYSSPPPDSDAFPRERAQWERITLAPDVELHVRRPQSLDMNRRLERLLEAARDLFVEE